MTSTPLQMKSMMANNFTSNSLVPQPLQQLCNIIKEDESLKHIWVVLVTARSQESDLERGREVGADSYYVKPFSPLALIKEIEEHA